MAASRCVRPRPRGGKKVGKEALIKAFMNKYSREQLMTLK